MRMQTRRIPDDRSRLTIVDRARRTDRLRYDGTISWAYMMIVREERQRFVRLTDAQFEQAVNEAARADLGHEHEYIVPEYGDFTDNYGRRRRRDRWFDQNRETLLQRARENIRDRAQALRLLPN